MFDRATIRLGIGPHSSSSCSCIVLTERNRVSELDILIVRMTSDGSRCDETSAGDDCYVQLPRRIVEQMTETCRIFLMTAAHLVQPASTNDQVSFPSLLHTCHGCSYHRAREREHSPSAAYI